MKKILIPVDFSDASYNAVDVAASIANATGAGIELFHVFKTPGEQLLIQDESEDVDENLKEQFHSRNLNEVENKLDEISKLPELQGIPVHYEIDTESSEKAIPADISRNLADLVVMGTEKILDFDKCFIIGNRTQEVIHSAKCPVLTVIKKIPDFTLKHIVYVTDMSEDKFKIARNIEWLVKGFNARVTFLYVNTRRHFKTKSELNDDFAYFQEKFNIPFGKLNIYDADKIFSGIIEFSEENKADLIVMPTSNISGIRNFIFGSHTENVLTHTEIPIMTYHLWHKIFRL